VNGSSTRRRKADERKPVVHGTTGQTLMRGSAFVTPPAPSTQVVIGSKQLEEILCYALVDIQMGTQGGIEALDSAGSPMVFFQKCPDSLKQFVRFCRPTCL
jgi:hypothetical protein